MRNERLFLFKTKNLLDKRDKSKMEKFFGELLDPYDYDYMATITEDDIDVFVCCFDYDKIKLMENILTEYNILVSCQDITDDLIKFNIPNEVSKIMEDHPENKWIVEDFILFNLDLDNVLDKISESGLESLNKIEKRFLNSIRL
jgi:hypothetical protein